MPLPQVVNASIAEDVFLVLLTIAHPNLDPPIRMPFCFEAAILSRMRSPVAQEIGIPVEEAVIEI